MNRWQWYEELTDDVTWSLKPSYEINCNACITVYSGASTKAWLAVAVVYGTGRPIHAMLTKSKPTAHSDGSHSTSVCKSRFKNGSCRNSLGMVGTWKKLGWLTLTPTYFCSDVIKIAALFNHMKTWKTCGVWTSNLRNMILTALDWEYCP